MIEGAGSSGEKIVEGAGDQKSRGEHIPAEVPEMPIPARPSAPPTELLRRGEARLLAALPGLASATEEPTMLAESTRTIGQVPAIADGPRYTFGPVFAAGGLGVVRRGEDRRLGRTIAIKELLRDSPQAQQRFALEAAITARLQHPGIVPLYDLGWQGSGKPYYCMKLVDGESLEARICRTGDVAGRLRLVEHVIAVADAIAYAHDQQVLHRDLKPANVLVGRFGETVVIDWGLAKDLSGRVSAEAQAEAQGEAAAPGISDMTEAGTVMGTLRYMPPEQAAGEAVDVRSDVYALGAMLYHVLAGAPPFAEVVGPALIKQVMAGSFVDLRRSAPGVPRELAAIAQRAMARDPGDRYSSAGAFAEDLRRFLAGRLVQAHAYSLREVAGLWLRRHRVVVGAASTLVVALAVTSVIAGQRISQARADQMVAERAGAEAAERADRAAFERQALATAGRAGEVLRLAGAAGQGREALVLGAQVLAEPEPPRIAIDGVSLALASMLPVASLTSAEHAVYTAAFSPDSRLVATFPWKSAAPEKDGIRVWSTGRGALQATLPAGDNPFGMMVFAPDGRRLAVSGADRCTVWHVGDAKKLQELPGCAEPLFSPDGATLYGKVPGAVVGGSQLYTGLAAWRDEDARPRWTREIRGDNFVALVHPDGRILVKRDHHSGEVVDVIAADSGAVLMTLTSPTRATTYGGRSAGFVVNGSLAIAPDGQHVAVGESSERGRLLLWDLATRDVRVLGLGDAMYRSLAFAGDDRLVSWGLELAMFDVASGAQTLMVPGVTLAATLGASVLASDGDMLWRQPGGAQQALPRGEVTRLLASPDGQFFVTVAGSGATLWSARDHLAVDRWTPPRRHTVVSFAAGEVVTRDAEGGLWVHDRNTQSSLALAVTARGEDEEVDVWRVPGGVWRRVQSSLWTDGNVHTENRVSLHDAASGAELFTSAERDGGFFDRAGASRATTRFAAATSDGIVVQDAARSQVLCTLAAADTHALALSDSGAWVAALDEAGGLGIWEVATCERRVTATVLAADEIGEQIKYLRSFAVTDGGSAVVRHRMRTTVASPDGAPRVVDDPCRPSQPWGYSRLSPDGRTLLTSCESSQSHERGWLRDAGDPSRGVAVDLGGYTGEPRFSPEGDALAFTTTHGQIALIDPKTGTETAKIRGQSAISAFVLRGDGVVDALAADGAVHSYPTSVDGLAQAACRALAGTASADEVAAVCPRP